MNDWAVLMLLEHDQGHGSAHCVMTLEKPASLPPIVIVTIAVLALSDETCLLSTSVVVAPEQAANVSCVFGRCAAISSG